MNAASKSRAVWLLIKQLLTHQILHARELFTSLVSLFCRYMETIYPSRKVLLRTNQCVECILFELPFGWRCFQKWLFNWKTVSELKWFRGRVKPVKLSSSRGGK